MRLQVEDLDKQFDGRPLLAGVGFVADAGDFLAVIGRSGSGKSTLLHLLAAIERPDRGRILLDGEDLAQAPEARRCDLRRQRLGLVFQSGNLLPTLDVLDNLRLPLELAGYKGAAAAVEARRWLALLGLGALERQSVERLSGGEQQRVAVARALVHRPSLVLADEPTASLDEDNAAVVLDLLLAACREQGATLVMATHAQEVIGRAGRRLRLEHGRLQEE